MAEVMAEATVDERNGWCDKDVAVAGLDVDESG